MTEQSADKQKTTSGWSALYPVEQPDAVQRLLDPLLNCRLFSGAILIFIFYSMVNLYQSYQVQTPLELQDLRRISSVISAIFMLEFLLKFASRRFVYLKREGIVDFLAASDFFSPAVRATKFVRFLRVLRLLRVVRGAKMMKKRASKIENDIFTSFSTATILVMLAFVAVKSHYAWQTTRDRVHERLLPVTAAVEKRLQTDADGFVVVSDKLASVEIALVEHPDFVSAAHIPPGREKPDWQLATRREIDTDRLTQVLKEIEGQFSRPRWTQVPARDRSFLKKEVIGSLWESPTPRTLHRTKQNLYLRRHHAAPGAARDALGDALALLKTVPVYLSPVGVDQIAAYLTELGEQHFPEEILTIRHENASGTLTYRFLLDDEYIEGREDEFAMLVATFVLIIMIVLVLNLALKDVIGPLGEIRAQTKEMAENGELRSLSLSKHPDNEIGEIVDNINKIKKMG